VPLAVSFVVVVFFLFGVSVVVLVGVFVFFVLVGSSCVTFGFFEVDGFSISVPFWSRFSFCVWVF